MIRLTMYSPTSDKRHKTLYVKPEYIFALEEVADNGELYTLVHTTVNNDNISWKVTQRPQEIYTLITDHEQ